jgi:hypothetical protein
MEHSPSNADVHDQEKLYNESHLMSDAPAQWSTTELERTLIKGSRVSSTRPWIKQWYRLRIIRDRSGEITTREKGSVEPYIKRSFYPCVNIHSPT